MKSNAVCFVWAGLRLASSAFAALAMSVATSAWAERARDKVIAMSCNSFMGGDYAYRTAGDKQIAS